MLKAVILHVKGWFRKQVNDNVDLSLAGKEQIHEARQSLERARDERNNIAAQHRLTQDKIKEVEAKIEKATAAVRHHNEAGDTEKSDKAYAIYQTEYSNLEALRKELKHYADSVVELDKDIVLMESDINTAQAELRKGAATQRTANAGKKIEGIHSSLNHGALSGAVESAKEQNAINAIQRENRQIKRDGDSVLDISAGIPSKEELLKK